MAGWFDPHPLWACDLEAPVGPQAIRLAGLVSRGEFPPRRAEEELGWLEALADPDNAAEVRVLDLLRRTIDKATGKTAFLAEIEGARHLRVAFGERGEEVMIHQTRRPDAPPGSVQVTRFGLDHGAETVPFGHHYMPTLEAAVDELWTEHGGPFRVIDKRNPGARNWRDLVIDPDYVAARLKSVDPAHEVERVLAVGAVPPLEFQGAGGSGSVFCDARGIAFKVAHHLDPGGEILSEEVAWLRAAKAHPQTARFVPKVFAWHPEEAVIVRECVRGERPRWASRWQDWHEQLNVPGWTKPEGGIDQWVETPTGPVLVDGGHALRRGEVLARHVEDLLRQGPSRAGALDPVLGGGLGRYGERLQDLAWAVYVDRNQGYLHPERATALLARLREAGDVSEWSEPSNAPNPGDRSIRRLEREASNEDEHRDLILHKWRRGELDRLSTDPLERVFASRLRQRYTLPPRANQLGTDHYLVESYSADVRAMAIGAGLSPQSPQFRRHEREPFVWWPVWLRYSSRRSGESAYQVMFRGLEARQPGAFMRTPHEPGVYLRDPVAFFALSDYVHRNCLLLLEAIGA